MTSMQVCLTEIRRTQVPFPAVEFHYLQGQNPQLVLPPQPEKGVAGW